MMRSFITVLILSLSIYSTSVAVESKKENNDSIILSAIKEGDLTALRDFPEIEKNVNRKYGNRGSFLLSYAIQNGQLEISNYLIDLGADLEHKTDRKTPLMFSARYGYPEITRLLLDCGADINATNRDRNTAFHYAAKYNNLDVLRILAESGAKINIPNNDRWTALDYSIINGKDSTEMYLKSIGCILFDKNLPSYFDGPYVNILDSDSYRVNYLVNSIGKKGTYLLSKEILHNGEVIEFEGLRKDRNSYTIVPDPVVPPSFYNESSKIFAIGDIHGQYERLVEMLIAGGIVDKKLKWVWGDGDLVFMGDILDRGEGVMETYWLIYRLEQEAKKVNGKVHLLLGNHEAMIIKNDIRYIANKYYGLTSNLDLEFKDLFSENTVLGKWLRTKNCVEVIGSTLFVHAGISPELAIKKLSIDEINNGFRSLLEKSPQEYSDIEKFLISSFGPVWYRGYVKESSGYEEIDQATLDSILEQYNVGNVVVGHSEVDLIEPLKNGKVIPINIPLADRNIIGQAILIEDDIIYRLATDKSKTKIN